MKPTEFDATCPSFRRSMLARARKKNNNANRSYLQVFAAGLLRQPTSGPYFMNRNSEPDNPDRKGKTAGAGSVRAVTSEELLQGHQELLITHNGRQYRLRVTQNGKLILNA